MGIFDELKMINIMMKFINLRLIKDAKVIKTWKDDDGNKNAEIDVTDNDGNITKIVVMLKNDTIIAAFPLSVLGVL